MNIKHAGENAITMLVTLMKTALSAKVDKVEGKGLSANDYTTEEKAKLAGLAQSDWDASAGGGAILNKPTKLSQFENDSKFITEDQVPEGATGSTTVPNMDGTAAVGTETAFARGDHIHPSDTSRVPVSRTINGKTLSADLTLSAADVGAVTGTEVDEKIAAAVSTVYKPQGSIAFAELPAPEEPKSGFVYNITDAFTTNASFLEGAGVKYPAGTNVVIVGERYDVLAGIIDLSGYVQSSEIGELTNEEVTGIWNSVVM